MSNIVTSRSAVGAYQSCPRKRYWQYESENGTATSGWERKALAIPLVTGIYVHQGLEAALKGMPAQDAAQFAKVAYLNEVNQRGLQVEEGTDEQMVVEEQAAHVEALVLAWARVRLPRWQEEFEVVEVEVEDRVSLSEDVVLAVRADAVVRRKYDHRLFVVNFKTVAQADERWLKGWEVDMQLMTELLAAEHRHGQQFGGVIIEGLIKGRRMPQKSSVGDVTGYQDSTPLLYGYKCDANPPLTSLEYGWEYTRRKGWYKFPVWHETFAGMPIPDHVAAVSSQGMSPLSYWINWLPEEVIEGQFVTVPAIMRNEQMIEHCTRQIVSIERLVHADKITLEHGESYVSINTLGDKNACLDERFPQNFHSCLWPSRCPMWDMCFVPNVAEAPGESGLYQARVDHHKVEEPVA